MGFSCERNEGKSLDPKFGDYGQCGRTFNPNGLIFSWVCWTLKMKVITFLVIMSI